MKKFLFIIPQSPKRIITPLRQRLIDASMTSLLQQSSNNWEALLLGDEKRQEGNCHYMHVPVGTKEEKLHFVVDYLLAQKNLPEFIIRFDDDDLIHPELLEMAGKLDFDCYADQWHTFYDVSSGKLSGQKRDWLANTVIHKTEHALASYGEYHYVVHSDLRRPHLLQNDHSKWWHQYYKGKKVVFADKKNPMYVRVLSPTSYTAGANGDELNKEQYLDYLERFGDWSDTVPASFLPYTKQLQKSWQELYGPLWENNFSSKNNIIHRLNRLFRK